MGDVSQEKRNILVLAEVEDGKIAPLTLELLGIGEKIAADLRGTLSAALIGDEIDRLSEEMASFSDQVYSLRHRSLREFDVYQHGHALRELCRKISPDIVMMGHTLNNSHLAPILAYQMGVKVVTDCIQMSLEEESGNLVCFKPVYGAKFVAAFKLEKRPWLVTLRSKLWEPIHPRATKGEVIPIAPILEETSAGVECVERKREESIKLNKADAIVSAGRGVKDLEGLGQLRGLVEVLKNHFRMVELGASRPLVDAHLVPSSRQVGLTGEKVAPELYVAVGISGSLQHVTGITGSKKIVAINADPKARIFEVSDYGVVGNFEEVVPALVRTLEELH